jgi:hypothetical protein
MKKHPSGCLFYLLRGESQLLGFRVGSEQRKHILSVEKIAELVPRQNFLTKKF